MKKIKQKLISCLCVVMTVFSLVGSSATLITPVYALSTPSTITISAGRSDSGYIKITWDDNGADGYKVYRSTDKSTWTCVSNTTSDEYVDKTGSVGTTYYYKARAYNVSGSTYKYSSYSNVVGKVQANIAKPSTAKLVWNSGTTKATFKWSSVSNADGYQIYKSTDNSTWTLYQTMASSATSSTISLSGSYTYSSDTLKLSSTALYKIRAYRVLNGTTYYSNYTVPLTTNVVTHTTALRTNSGYVKITWDENSQADGFKVYRSTDKDTWECVSNTTSNEYVDKTGSVGTTYYYKVKSYKIYGSTYRYSTPGDIVSKVQANIAQPSGFTATVKSGSSVKLSWTKVSNASGYIVYRSTDNSTWTTVKTITSGSTVSYTDSSVPASSSQYTFYYKIRAYRTLSGTKYNSNYSTVKTVDMTDGLSSTTAYYGKITIGDYSSKLYCCLPISGSTAVAQEIVDATNSAYIGELSASIYIADHSYQGLKEIWDAAVGDTATLTLNNGCVVTLTCTKVYHNIFDSQLTKYEASNRLMIKTCESGGGSTYGNTVTLWKISSYTSSTGSSISKLTSYITTRLDTLF